MGWGCSCCDYCTFGALPFVFNSRLAFVELVDADDFWLDENYNLAGLGTFGVEQFPF